MNHGRTVFAQLLEFVPFSHFKHLVDLYQANKGATAFPAWSHFICLMYAQLTRRSGLRDLIACLNAQPLPIELLWRMNRKYLIVLYKVGISEWVPFDEKNWP